MRACFSLLSVSFLLSPARDKTVISDSLKSSADCEIAPAAFGLESARTDCKLC